MKRLLMTLILILGLVVAFTKPVLALSKNQSEAIQKLLNDAGNKSGARGLSLSIVDGDETLYFSSGHAKFEKRIPATEHTLYELASVSKAFTGVGILLLEEKGLLTMTDPIKEYLPWLSFEYKGEPIDMQELTLDHFLHHTSGLTNERHFQEIPQGSSSDMLLKTVETLKETELEFLPGQHYKYGTINYDVLGLVIETVSNKSYESFMTDEVFQPLGLYDTYLYEEDALKTGQMSQGYRTSFLIKSPYNAPAYAGNKPAGYVISSSVDMARWIKIQTGLIEDIPNIFKRVIKNSHHGNQTVSPDNGMYYGAGWLVNSDKSFIEHDGINPSFSSQVVIYPKKKRAISLLTNSADTNNRHLVESINEILEGNLIQNYQLSAMQISDIILSAITIFFILLAILFFILGFRRKSTHEKGLIRKNRKRLVPILFAVTFVLFLLSWFYPIFIGYDWNTLLVWQSYSLLSTLISLTLLSASFTWFVSKG